MAGVLNADEFIKLDKLKKDLDELIKTLVDAGKATVNFSNELKEQGLTIKDITASSERLKKEKKELSDSEKESQRIQKESIKILNDKKIADNENLGTLERLRAANRNLTKEREKLNLSTKDGIKRSKEINKELDNNNKILKKNSDALTQQRLNIGNYSSALEGLGGKFGAAVGGVKMFGNAIKGLMLNPVLLTIGAIVLVLQQLTMAFKSTDEGATEYEARLGQLKAVTDIYIGRLLKMIDVFKSIGSTIKNVFTGEFKQAWESFKGIGENWINIFRGLGDEFNNSTDAAYNLVKAMDALNDRIISQTSQQAKNANEIAKLIALSKDQTKTDEERLAALEKALALSKEESEFKKTAAKEEYDLTVKNLAAKYKQYGVTEDLIKQFIESDAAASDELMKNNKAVSEFRNRINDEGQKSLEDLYSKMINADTEYYTTTRKLAAQASGFKNDLEKEAHDKKIAYINGQRDAIADSVKYEQTQRQKVADETKRVMDLEKKKLQEKEEEAIRVKAIIDEQYLAESSQAILRYQERLKLGKSEQESNIILAEDLAKAKILQLELYQASLVQGSAEWLDLQVQINDEEIALDQLKYEEKLGLLTNYLDSSAQAVSSLNGILQGLYDKDLQNIEKSRKKELELYGKKEKDKQRINEKFDKEAAAIKRKQAIADKAAALIQAGIHIAIGIAANLKNPIMLPIISALGALQLAAIAAAPIPEFADGVENFKGGVADVGDGGMAELIKTPDNRWFMSPNTRSRVFLPKGSNVYSGEETKEMLKDGGISLEKFDELISEQKNTQKAINKIKILNTSYTSKGIERVNIEGNNRTKYVNKYFR